MPDSPAVDAAIAGDTTNAFDQRGQGFTRVHNGAPDMGAFELQPIPGDFDGDYEVGCSEVNQLAEAIFAGGEPDTIHDLTADGLVHGDDMDALLTSIATHRLHTRESLIPGDANLDGAVDVSDFNIWLTHRSTNSGGPCRGDFDLNGTVDEADHAIWTENRFRSVIDGEATPAPESPQLADQANMVSASSNRWKHKLLRRRTRLH